MSDTDVSTGRKARVAFLITLIIGLTCLLGGILFLVVFNIFPVSGIDNYVEPIKSILSVTIKFIFPIILIIAGVICLIISLMNYSKWKKVKADVRELNEEINEREFRVGITNKRKLKFIFLIAGPVIAICGLAVMVSFNYAVPSVVVGLIIIVIGVGLLIAALSIKTRRHAESRRIRRRQERDYLYVTYPNDKSDFLGDEFVNIYQDVVNDGFTEFMSYDHGERVITFRTPFDQKELQAQYNRRELYLNKSKRSSISMPSYYSDEPTIYYTEDRYENPPYQEEGDYWEQNRVQVGVRVKTWSDGTTSTTPITELRWFYFRVLREYREYGVIYYFYRIDNTPLLDERGEQVVVNVHHKAVTLLEKLDHGTEVSGNGVRPLR